MSPPSSPTLPPPGSALSPSSLARAMAQTANELTVVYFTTAIAALACLVITSHLAGNLLVSFRPRSKSVLGRTAVAATRYVFSPLHFNLT